MISESNTCFQRMRTIFHVLLDMRSASSSVKLFDLTIFIRDPMTSHGLFRCKVGTAALKELVLPWFCNLLGCRSWSLSLLALSLCYN